MLDSRRMVLVSALAAALLPGCDSDDGGLLATVRIEVAARADFGIKTGVMLSGLETACPAQAPGDDSPAYAAGLDCDGDSGPIAFLTPSVYKVAFKRVTFVHETDGPQHAVPDAGKLSASGVVDITQEVTIGDLVVPGGRYTQLEVELYWFELVLGQGAAQKHVRIYLSDDDFASEGALGHHQGDITLVDDAGNESGFVAPAKPWTAAEVTATRGDTQGAGGVDAETGHKRGLFGNTALWDKDGFAQGAQKDVYIISQAIDRSITKDGTKIAFVFDVKDAWFFEDFNQDGQFSPCEGSKEACDAGAAWAPLFREPSITVE